MENRKLPVYKLVIDEESEQLGVNAVALVDAPAIERDFLAFNETTKQVFEVSNQDKRIVSGALMIPNYPIYRADQRGEYYVIFDKQTIETIVHKFFKQGFNNSVNKMHNAADVVNAYLFESFIIDSERGLNTPKGLAPLPDGTWYGSYKIQDDEVWQSVKEGRFKGFSVEGMFDMVMQTPDTDEELLNKIKSILNSTLSGTN